MNVNYLVVARKSPPEELKQYLDLTKQPVRHMLNGYRNRLSKDLRLILTPNLRFCGQAYRFILSAEPPASLLTYENEQQRVEQVQNNYVIVAKHDASMFDPSTSTISEQELKQILGELDDEESNSRARNLLLNVFDCFADLQKCGLSAILGKPESQEVGECGNDVSQFSGKNVFLVPEFDNKTGNWTKEHSYQLKIEAKKANSKQEDTAGLPQSKNNELPGDATQPQIIGKQ